MIKSTFQILNGVGEKTEQRLWQSGILSWDDFLSSRSAGQFSPLKKKAYDEAITEASRRLEDRDHEYFFQNVKRNEHWRLFDVFGGEAVCLDIETNGYGAAEGGYPTVVGLYDGEEFKAFVRGDNLDLPSLMDELSRYRYLITFFGSSFDIPFLEASMPGFRLDIPHFDLCFAARKIGMKGGLKRIEQELGFVRPLETQGMDGYAAVILWNRAMRGDRQSLELLIKYNREDTVNLMGLAGIIYSRLRESTGIDKITAGVAV